MPKIHVIFNCWIFKTNSVKREFHLFFFLELISIETAVVYVILHFDYDLTIETIVRVAFSLSIY